MSYVSAGNVLILNRLHGRDRSETAGIRYFLTRTGPSLEII